MKEIPILFSTPMVQDILEGRKSQTRRIMKPQIKDCDHSRYIEVEWKDKPIQWSETALKIGRAYCGCCGNGIEYSNDFGGIKCPYGKPGDIIWVRETWRYLMGYIGEWPHQEPVGYIYKADEDDHQGKYKPSIHMPKEAARIWLQVTDVRVERLQDISEEDAKAEGVEKINDGAFPYKHYGGSTASCADAKTSFRTLWLEINGDESWDVNPFLWVISFKVLSTTGKPGKVEEVNNITKE